jgi:hypothetical protein
MTAFFRKKYFIGIVIIVAALIIAVALVFLALKERSHDNVLSLPDIAAPSGWYAHHIDTMSPSFLIFTRDPVLPVRSATELGAYGEQIDVDVATTTLSPQDYIVHEGFFDDPAGQVFDSNWSTLNNRPLFTIRGEDAEGTDFKAEYLFASSTVYEFDLYIDDAKNYGDFQKIVNEVSVKLR